MSATPKVLPSLDTDLEADQDSWSSLPEGFKLQIQTSPDHELALDDEGNLLLIQ
jgi:hypothetical protein